MPQPRRRPPLPQPTLFDPPPQRLPWETLPLATRQEALRLLALMLRRQKLPPRGVGAGKGAVDE